MVSIQPIRFLEHSINDPILMVRMIKHIYNGDGVILIFNLLNIWKMNVLLMEILQITSNYSVLKFLTRATESFWPFEGPPHEQTPKLH